MMIFLQKITDISKIKKEALGTKSLCFLKLHMCVYLRTKFQLFSIILTSFRQGVILPNTPSSASQNKPLKISGIKISVFFENFDINVEILGRLLVFKFKYLSFQLC